MSMILTWFMGTSVGKGLRWVAGGALVALMLVVAYFRWRSTQREVGAEEAREEQKKIDQKADNDARTIEDAVRHGDPTANRSELRDYAAKHRR